MDELLSNIQKTFYSTNGTNSNSSLLKGQQINQQTINELLNQSADAILCGPACQKLKIAEQLKQKYLDAQTNAQTAPAQLEQSKKNYYIYAEGRQQYEHMKEKELQEKSAKISQLIETNFNGEIKNANTMNSYLNTALTNSENTQELLVEYIDKNQALKLKLRESRGDILTNDRKTYYEMEALNSLYSWYSFFWYIYYILVIVLLLSFAFSPNEISIQKKGVILVLFMFYPYYINYIVQGIFHMWHSLAERLPKNVYNNL
jgi:hypothetical protein